MILKNIKATELELFVNDMDTVQIGWKQYSGFRYLSPNDCLAEDTVDFLVALDGEDLIGILKIATLKEKTRRCKIVSFVDVKVDFRRQGIATRLYEFLGTLDFEEDLIVNSPLNMQGKSAKLDKLLEEKVVRYSTKVSKDSPSSKPLGIGGGGIARKLWLNRYQTLALDNFSKSDKLILLLKGSVCLGTRTYCNC